VGVLRLNDGMPISYEELKQHIHQSGVNADERLRTQALEIIWNGIQLFRENKVRRYRSHKDKLIKKPLPSHQTSMGRYDQEPARVILISAICRAWIVGVYREPTLNNKKEYDSAFMTFALHILASEGIGHIHKHLEEYWSIRKHDWLKNSTELEKWRLSGGSETIP
jgi:hypothetical protein